MDETLPKAGDDVTTLLRASFDPSPLPAPFQLIVVEGPDAGQSFALDGSQPSRVLVGQSPACAIRLSDRTVSRRHVALDVTGRQARITDLGSTNGTFVNSVRIHDAVVTGGELIQIGNTSFKLEYDTQASPFHVPAASHFGSLVGCSTEMRRLYPLCERLAQSDVPVLIEGEPGTGKEFLAEVLHEQSPRAQNAFVVFDCASVPANLIDAELFGHEAGSLPGLPHSRPGVLRQATGGTLYIDEVAELDVSAQPKLLRALERREVIPVGSTQAIPIDVRVITGTRRDLDREVQANRFRDDLLQRLAVTRIELPPLRQRRGDIPLLVRRFCEELGGDPQALTAELGRWEEHSWPGNVRELRNTVARHLALGELAGLAMREAQQPDIPEGDFIDGVLELTLGEARQKVVEEFERRYVERMLNAHGGNVTRAAESAGVARRYFQILKRRSKERQAR